MSVGIFQTNIKTFQRAMTVRGFYQLPDRGANSYPALINLSLTLTKKRFNFELQLSGCTHYTWTDMDEGSCAMFDGQVKKEDAFPTDDPTMICGIYVEE